MTVNRIIACGVALFLCGGTALALGASTSPTVAKGPNKQPVDVCQGQWVKYCGKVQEGAGRRLICMNDHASQLPPDCRTHIQKLFGYESGLAAKNHMTLSQYMAWAQNLMITAPSHGGLVVPMNSATKTAPSQTNPGNGKQK
jgi:hypothetical protein